MKETVFYVMIFINMGNALLVIMFQKILKFLIMVNAIVSKIEFEMNKLKNVQKIIQMTAFIRFVENAKKIIV